MVANNGTQWNDEERECLQGTFGLQVAAQKIEKIGHHHAGVTVSA